jgi:hypothetical protein
MEKEAFLLPLPTQLGLEKNMAKIREDRSDFAFLISS